MKHRAHSRMYAITTCIVLLAGCQARQDRAALFHNARGELMRGAYARAASEFERFLERFPDHALASRASFLLAKCHLGLNNYNVATRQFEATIREFPESEEAHKSRYKLGVIAMLSNFREAALQHFRPLVEQPDGVLAPEATALVRFLEAAEEPAD